jgi:anti-sigma-K factor RskA
MAMSGDRNMFSERDEIELLLPWYVMGRLDAADTARVEAALARDPSLERQFRLIREEFDESVAGNAAIADRPASKADRLMADVAKRRQPARRPAPRAVPRRGLWERLAELFALPMGGMRLAGAAAALLIVVQAGIIGTLALRQAGTYAPASGITEPAPRGTVALVGFVDSAATAAVIELLAAHEMTIVDGPDASGLFTVRVGPDHMGEAERNAKLEVLKRRADVVAVAVLLR